MRALYLGSSFLAIAIASSGLAWLAALNAGLSGVVGFIYAALGFFWVMAWIIDEPMQAYLRCDENSYNGALLGFAAAAIFGGLARLCLRLLT
jgi:hypothetical protein